MAKRKQAAKPTQPRLLRSPAKIDKRLLGTWKSDRKRTFQGHPWPKSTTAEQNRRFRALFGKLVVRWTPTRCLSEMDDFRGSCRYTVLGSDEQSVAVYRECTPAFPSNENICHIHFDGDEYYYVHIAGTRLIEYFRRVHEPQKAGRT